MKRRKYIKGLWVAILMLIATHYSYAQSYSIYPNDTIEGSVPFNDLFHFIIQQKNLTSEKIVLSWQKIYAVIPEGWNAYLCDLGSCYDNFPDSGTMDTVVVGEYGLLSVGVNPFEISGTAVVQYTVWDEAHPEKVDTLTWVINSESATGIDFLSPDDFIVYPNPAKNLINILGLFQEGISYKISNCNGIIVDQGNNLNSQSQISLGTFPDGIYFVTIYCENNVYSERLIIKR